MRSLAVVAMLAGCASYQSSFHRTRADAGELVWAYDNGFQVVQNGKLIAEQGNWAGLSGAVACVPQARSSAESAASRSRTGKLLSWGGVAVMIAGVVAGTVLVFRDTSNTDDVLLGLGVMGGGLVVGLPPVASGLVMRARADTTAIDAVNLYNDERGHCRPVAMPTTP